MLNVVHRPSLWDRPQFDLSPAPAGSRKLKTESEKPVPLAAAVTTIYAKEYKQKAIETIMQVG
ncbi:MAG: hypothetical protein KAV00_11860 [Phycisphaerae bacterium]|nr:hypothetical protein [Phycisphaerae bacterium]